MTGHHAGPRKDRTRFLRGRGTASLAVAPAVPAPPPAGPGRIPSGPAPGPSLPRRVADSGAVAAGLRARRDLTRQRDIPTAVLPALRAWAAGPPPRPRCGEVSAIWVGQIAYPLSGVLDPRQYAATLRHIGLATGTTTGYEADSAWRLALDPGTGATA